MEDAELDTHILLRAAAFHEAAHAAVGRLLGLPCSGARISRRGSGSSFVFKDGASVMQRLMVHLAGNVGEEEEFSGINVPRADSVDQAKITALVDHYGVRPWQLRQLERIVRQYLYDNGLALHRIATTLLKRRHLGGRDIDILWDTYRGVK
jgi:hypothetical protein